MIKAAWVLVVAIAAALAGYNSYYWTATNPAKTMLQQSRGEMQWLRREFNLTDAQFARIGRLHEEYTPKCVQMCLRIVEANANASRLIATNHAVTPEVEAALSECSRVHAECRRAMLDHVYGVAREMSPAQGARYIAMMRERIIEPSLSHDAVVSNWAREK